MIATYVCVAHCFGGLSLVERLFSFTSEDSTYTANITLVGDMAHFSVSAKVEASKWVSIGLNSIPSMPGADYIIGWVSSDGSASVQEYYTPPCPCGPEASHQVPVLGVRQDLSEVSGVYRNGITTIKFSRKINTGDSQNKVIDPTKIFVLFAWGGSYDATNNILSSNPTSLVGFFTSMHGYYADRDVKEMSCLEVKSTIATCETSPVDAFVGSTGPVLPDLAGETPQGAYVFENSAETYRVVFTPQEKGQVRVTIYNSIDAKHRWTAVGFNEKPLMRNSTNFIAWIDSNDSLQWGEYTVADNDFREAPVLDKKNYDQYTAVSSSYKDGLFSVTFTRAIDMKTGVFLYAFGGLLDNGSFNVKNGIDEISQYGFRHTTDQRGAVSWMQLKKQ